MLRAQSLTGRQTSTPPPPSSRWSALPKRWAIGGWLLVGGEKMSRSSGNALNPLDLTETAVVDIVAEYNDRDMRALRDKINIEFA